MGGFEKMKQLHLGGNISKIQKILDGSFLAPGDIFILFKQDIEFI